MEVGAFYPLTEDGEVDSLISALPIKEGVNSLGRNDSLLFTKQVSRTHISINASSDGTLEISVEGPNPIVVRSGSEKKKLSPKTKGLVKDGDVVEFIPGQLPFKYIVSNLSVPPEECTSDVSQSINKDEQGVGLLSVNFLKEDELVRKRKCQMQADEALARLLQEEEDRALTDGIGLSNFVNFNQETGDMLATMHSNEIEAVPKRLKLDSKMVDHPSSFCLMHTQALPQWANMGCVRIEDVIHGDVEVAILTNYMVDVTWLLSACPVLKRARQVVIIHGESGQSLELLQVSKPSNWILFKPPLRISYGTHHSKAMFLVYPTGVRIIVHTANLIYVDWNNKTQGLWMQDFPLKETAKQMERSNFESDLVDYLEALEWSGCTVSLPCGETRINANFFRKFNYSSASVRLVASVPGYHKGRNLTKWGHMKLRTILQEQNFEEQFQGSSLAYQFSSLGSLDEKWINEFTASTCAGYTVGKKPLGPGKVQIVWPTVEDIRHSLEGYAAGNAVPSPEKNVKKEFLQKYWARWTADHMARGRAMPHIKTYVRYNRQSLAWMLLTSSNLSKAAWGSLQRDGTQLMIRSYELGVCFLPSLVLRSSLEPFSCTNISPWTNGAERNSLSSSSGGKQISCHPQAKLVTTCYEKEGGKRSTEMVVIIPVPYRLPPSPYGPGDEPWSWDRQYTKPDVYGEVWPRSVQLYSNQGV